MSDHFHPAPPHQAMHQPCSPEFFSRGALDLTFRFLRQPEPRLALIIQNILAQKITKRQVTDQFQVDLPPEQVSQILSTLTYLGEQALSNSHGKSQSQDNGQLLVLRCLIQDWSELGHWLLQNHRH